MATAVNNYAERRNKTKIQNLYTIYWHLFKIYSTMNMNAKLNQTKILLQLL